MKSKINFKELIKKFNLEIFTFFVFILVRIPRLGFDIINTDAPVWKTRTFIFSNAIFSGDFAGTNVTYHPGVTLTWISAWGVKFYNLFADLFLGGLSPDTVAGYVGLHFTQKLLLVIFYAFCISLSVYLLKNLFSKNFALLFFFVLTFEPYFLAFTRVLHTDALITTTSLLSVLSYFYYNRFNNKVWLYTSGVFAGLALLTKSNGLFLVGYIGIAIFILKLLKFVNFKEFVFDVAKEYFVWLLLVCLTFFVLWPAMWVTPLNTLTNYYNGIVNIGLEAHYQSWFGIEVSDPGPTFYPIVMFIRLTPWFILFSGSGVLLVFLKFFKYKKLDIEMLLGLVFVVLYIFFLSISDKKLGRYALPTLPFLSMFVVYSLVSLVSAFKLTTFNFKIGKWINLSIYWLISLAFLCLSLVSTYRIFPDYYMYYSPLVGGFSGGSRIEEPKWPIGYSVLAKHLNSLDGAEDRYVLVRYGYLYNPFNISGETGTLSQKTEKDPGAYFILEKYSDYRYLDGKNYVLKEVIEVGGIDYFWVYEITGNNWFNNNYKYKFPAGLKIETN